MHTNGSPLSATDLIDDLDAEKFAVFTGRDNPAFVPMTPPSNKSNKSDQNNSATKSAGKGSARKGTSMLYI
jgi:hypothetical protein